MRRTIRSRTIRIKLFLLFTAFLAGFALLGCLISMAFLERYDVWRNRDLLLEVRDRVERQLRDAPKDAGAFIEQIDRVEGIGITITDPNRRILLNSYPMRADPDAARLPKEIEDLSRNKAAQLRASYLYEVLENPGEWSPKLVLVAQRADGGLIVLTKSMKGIREGAGLSIQFFLLAGLVLTLLGGFVMFFFSKRLVRPILEMNRIALGISNLDFSQRVSAEGEDEIGQLGRSVNVISEKLKISIDGLRQEVEFQKQLARNLSHEMKTPLGIIKGYAEGLQYGVADDPEKSERYCRVIAEECDRMDHMVRELLELSALEARGASLMHAARLPLLPFLGALRGRLSPLFEEHGISCRLACPESLTIFADAALLERAVSNLLTNAVAFNDDGKTVELSGEATETGTRITVFNTGAPIPEADRARIWELFYRTDRSRARRAGGHGLGLAIVRSIVHLHRGSASVVNLGDGVAFMLDFPQESPKDSLDISQ